MALIPFTFSLYGWILYTIILFTFSLYGWILYSGDTAAATCGQAGAFTFTAVVRKRGGPTHRVRRCPER